MKLIIIILLIVPCIVFAEFPNFEIREITQPDFGNPGVSAGDFDNDGLMDIVATVSDPAAVKLYQNTGLDLYWNEMLIAYVPALYLRTADINQDDLLDVLVTCSDHRVLLYLNSGNSRLDWEEIEITQNFTNPHGIDAGDIDDDGDIDVLATSQGLGKICWWEQDGDNWIEHLVSDAMPGSQSGCLFDLDSDFDLDIIGASSNANDIAVWINDGEPDVGLTQYVVEDSFQLAHWVSVSDLNDDGLPDIMGASYIDDEVAWWENNTSTPDTWPKHVISNTVNGALTVEAEDMDGDGDNDVLATAWLDDTVYVWENLDGSALNWTRHTISSSTNGVWSIHVAKLDDDEDFDIICGSDPLNPNQIAAPLTWWENDLNPTSVNNDMIPAKNNIVNYPNPFNPSTTIFFQIENINKTAQIDIYNLTGQVVKTFSRSQFKPNGETDNFQVIWNGTDKNDQQVSSGIYYSIVKNNDKIIASCKMLLIK